MVEESTQPVPDVFMEPNNTSNITVKLGTGYNPYRGASQSEYIVELRPWNRAYRVYRQMRDDSIIGGLLEAIKTPLLSSSFDVHAYSQSDADQRNQEFLYENIFSIPDLEWREHVEEMLDFIDFGFALSEKAAEKRKDGKMWIRALVPIGQETLHEWADQDQFGRVQTFIQRDLTLTEGPFTKRCPMSKLLHFTWRPRKRDPMGNPMLRSLYRPWFFKSNLEVAEAIGVERDVGNMPKAQLGDAYYSDEQLTELGDTLRHLRADDASYVIVPRGITLEPFGSGGKVYNTRNIIRDYQHAIRQRFFADFLSLGSEGVGSQALSREMRTFFGAALRSIEARMLEVWNRQLVPWLFRLNGIDLPIHQLPRIVWNPPERHNLQMMAQAISTLVGVDVLTADSTMEPWVREEFGIPPLPDDIMEKKKKVLAKEMEARSKAADQPPMVPGQQAAPNRNDNKNGQQEKPPQPPGPSPDNAKKYYENYPPGESILP